MEKIFGFFAERHLFANIFTVMVLFVGVITLFTIKRDLFPKVEIKEAIVTTIYPGASPEDVEINVTSRIERELGKVRGAQNVSSVSFENSSIVHVLVDKNLSDKESDEVLTEIRETIGRVSDLPKKAEKLFVDTIKTSDISVLEIGLSSDKMSYAELRANAKILEKRLKEIDLVSHIEKYGYRKRDVSVEVKHRKLNYYQIPIGEVIAAIEARNIRGKNGTFKSYAGNRDIVTLSEFNDPLEVGEVIVRTSFDGPSIKVKNLAKIEDGFEEEELISRINGEKVISLEVYKKDKSDIIKTAEAVKEFLEREKGAFPEDLKFHFTNDLSRYVSSSYDIVKSNGIMGFFIVIFVLTLFLNFRTSLWVAMGIPVSLLGAVALLPLFDIYLDVVTLSAMILILGIIVDDAIVVAESIYQRFENGEPPIEAAVNGLKDVFFPVMTTIITTILAFVPMFFIPGDIGKFIVVIPLVIIFALGISLVEGVVALPSHVAAGLKGKKAAKRKNWFEFIRKGYEKLMKYFLKLRYVLVIGFSLLFIFTIMYAKENMRLELS